MRHRGRDLDCCRDERIRDSRDHRLLPHRREFSLGMRYESGVDLVFGRCVLARTTVAPAAAVTTAAAFPFLARLLGPRLTRGLVGARLPCLARLSWVPRLAGRAHLLIAPLLVHIPPCPLAVAALAFIPRAIRSGFARRTIAARGTLVASAAFLTLPLWPSVTPTLARTAITSAFAAVPSARSFAVVALLFPAGSGLSRNLRSRRRGCGCRPDIFLLEPAQDAADDSWSLGVQLLPSRLRYGRLRSTISTARLS